MTPEDKNEPNYFPIDSTSGSSEIPVFTPDSEAKPNTPATPASDSNIVSSSNGSIMTNGTMQSPNFSPGASGWQIDSNGNVEFGNGKFRGDITGASGTFTGSITASTGSIGGFSIGADYLKDLADSFGLASTVSVGNDVRFWAGDTFANRATAPLRAYEDGSIVATNINATGAIYATSGWIGAATALVYESQGINTGTTGWIRGGMTGYNTGTGYFLGYHSGVYKFSIGDGTSNYLLWDGTNLTVSASKIVVPMTAGFALTAGQAVCIYTDGKVYPTNAEVSTALSFVGFCLTSTAKDAIAPIQIFGNFTGLSGLSLTNIPPIYYLKDGTHITDQQNNTGATETTADDTHWQSFTTGAGVVSISQVVIYSKGTSGETITVSIYTGEGTGGTQIGPSKVISPSAGFGQVYARFDVPITVAPNTQYSIVMVGSHAVGTCSLVYSNADPYAGGRNDMAAGYDYRFIIDAVNVYGAINTAAGTVSKKVGLATSATSLTLKDSI